MNNETIIIQLNSISIQLFIYNNSNNLLEFRNSSVGIRSGQPGVDSRQGQEIFLFSTASREALGPAQSPVKREPGALSPGVKRPGRKVYHSPPYSVEVKNGGAVPLLPHTSSWRSD
jgi:hypothetical protein